MAMHNVLVYGTLRKGEGNHRLIDMSKSTFLATYRIHLPFQMYHLGGFPGLVKTEDTNPITAELYSVDDDTFQRLDWLEGYPDFYNREQIELEEGTFAWIYYLNNSEDYDHCSLILSGDWLERYNEELAYG